MGILDRLFRRSRMGRFEGKDYLSDKDKEDVSKTVKKIYQNILNGHMTKEQGKEYLLQFVTIKVQNRYPDVDLEKTGLAGKINRYVSMKIRKLDEEIEHEDRYGKMVKSEVGLGEASRLGKIGKVKNELRTQFKKIRRRKGITPQWAYDYLMNYARAENLNARVGYPEPFQEAEYRNLVMEIIRENFDSESGELIKKTRGVKDSGRKSGVGGSERRKKTKGDKGSGEISSEEKISDVERRPSKLKFFPKAYIEAVQKKAGEKAGEDYYNSKAVKEEVLMELEGVLKSIPGFEKRKKE